MAYLQIGAPKSGNFWLYQILQQIREKSARSTRSFIEQQPVYKLAGEWELNFPEQARIDVLEITDLQCRYRISSIFKMPIEDMREYVSKSSHVWTHSRYSPRSPEVLNLFEKKIYVLRDPRDRALSAARYFTSPYMLKYFPQPETDPKKYLAKNFEKLMWEWVWHVFDYLRMREKLHIHFAFFEGFNREFQKELDQLLNYLEIRMTAEEKNSIEEAMSFKALKKENPNHVRKGQSGHWRDELSPQQAEWATAYTRPLLRFLGYPEDDREHMELNRDLRHHDFESLRRELIEVQENMEALPHT